MDITKINQWTIFIAAVLIALGSLFSALSFGAADTPLSDVLTGVLSAGEGSFNARIIYELRLPRTLLAFMAGAGLAIAGLILQTVTRNPLADPYLFGISSGASFGVVLLMAVAGISAGFMLSAAALLGSFLAMGLLILIAGRQKSSQVESMLLAGVKVVLRLYFSGYSLQSLRTAYFSTLFCNRAIKRHILRFKRRDLYTLLCKHSTKRSD